MADESVLYATASRRLLNFMTSLMPTLEGLFLVTVLDGKKGEVLIRYHAGVHDELLSLMRFLEQKYGEELRLR